MRRVEWEKFRAAFIARGGKLISRIHIRLMVGVYRRDTGKRVLSTPRYNPPPPRDVCATLPLNSLSALPSSRSYILPRKTEAAYKRKREVIQGGYP